MLFLEARGVLFLEAGGLLFLEAGKVLFLEAGTLETLVLLSTLGLEFTEWDDVKELLEHGALIGELLMSAFGGETLTSAFGELLKRGALVRELLTSPFSSEFEFAEVNISIRYHNRSNKQIQFGNLSTKRNKQIQLGNLST